MTKNFESQSIQVEPAVTMFETDSEVVIIADLPGVEKEDLDLSLKGETLRIEGKLGLNVTQNEQNQEIFWTGFVREIQVGDHVDVDDIKAKLENGLLRVTLGKVPSACPRKIEIT